MATFAVEHTAGLEIWTATDSSRAKTGAGVMLAISLATAAALIYNLASGGNPTSSSSPPMADTSEETSSPRPSSSKSRPPESSSSSRRTPHQEKGTRKGLFWSRRGEAKHAQNGLLNPTDETDRALLQASSAAVAESVGDNLSPREASAAAQLPMSD